MLSILIHRAQVVSDDCSLATELNHLHVAFAQNGFTHLETEWATEISVRKKAGRGVSLYFILALKSSNYFGRGCYRAVWGSGNQVPIVYRVPAT